MIGELLSLRVAGGGRLPHRHTTQRSQRNERWDWNLSGAKLPPNVALAAILVLAGVAVVSTVSRAGCKPKLIHVITPNTSCDGVQGLAAAAQPTADSGGSPAAAGAQLLQHILPLTNFSALTSAQVLASAAAANVSVPQLQPLMRQHQQLWCSAGLASQPLANATSVKYSNVSVFVYSSNDIVSNQIRGNGHGGGWEATEVKEMLWAVRQYWKQAEVLKHIPARPQVPDEAFAAPAAGSAGTTAGLPGAGRRLRHLEQQQMAGSAAAAAEQAGSSSSSGRRQLQASAASSQPLMLDIGSNIGWFAINAAAAGARVALFEAMDANLALLRRSLCANPWLADRMALFGTGLGTQAGSCSIVSDESNKGDGIVMCGKSAEESLKERGWNATTYKVRGQISIKRLDSLIQEDVQVLKMDVEGFELNVLRGAKGLLQRHNVWYLMLECNVGLVGAAGQMEYLKFLDGIGYSISTYGFGGPFLDPEDIRTSTVLLSSMNLFCVRKDLRQAQLAHRAGVTAPKKQP